MALRDAGQHCAGKKRLSSDLFAGQDCSECTGRRYAECRHAFRHDVLPEDRTQNRAPVAHARERRAPRSLELNVAAYAVGADHFAQQDGTSVAQLRHPVSELVACIGHGQWIRTFRNPVAGEDFNADRRCQLLRIEPQQLRQLDIQPDQPGLRDRKPDQAVQRNGPATAHSCCRTGKTRRIYQVRSSREPGAYYPRLLRRPPSTGKITPVI